jgi:predicted TIM-barrel fold metal-dependent hydrolase
MFHTVAIDDPGMLPVYAYCQQNFIPVCMHINPAVGGFAKEFVSVLTQFPDMKIVCPHLVLSSVQTPRLREFLDTFPNLYTDVSFGDHFAKDGLVRISKNIKKFRRLFADYPNRIMFGTDLVLTKEKRKTAAWVQDEFTGYLDMLCKDTYTTPIVPGETLRGLALPEEQLGRVLYRNYEEFAAKRPTGTHISRTIDWSQMKAATSQRVPASQGSAQNAH